MNEIEQRCSDLIKLLDVPAEANVDVDSAIAIIRGIAILSRAVKGIRLKRDTLLAGELIDFLDDKDRNEPIYVSVTMNDEVAYFQLEDYNDAGSTILICGEEIKMYEDGDDEV